MLVPSNVAVYVASHPVDFRRGADGLLALVRDAGGEPFKGGLYVFRAKRADRVKIVWRDGSGVCLYSKRLEKHKFCWPRLGAATIRLNGPQLLALIGGMDWTKVRQIPVKRPTSAG